jgi:hypothetical protein
MAAGACSQTMIRGHVMRDTARVGRGELRGTMERRRDNRPNFAGSIVLESDMPAGSRIWLSGWTKEILGSLWVSLECRDAAGTGPRLRRGAVQGDAPSVPRPRSGNVSPRPPLERGDSSGGAPALPLVTRGGGHDRR